MSSSNDPALDRVFEDTVALEDRAFFERAQAVARVGSWVAELEGSERLRWSTETFRIFEVASSHFDGTREAFYRFVHPDDVATVRTASQAAILDSRPYDVEHRIVTATGQVRWVHEKADVIRNAEGRAMRMIGTVQDVTERRLLEEQLRHAQKMEAIGQLAGGIAHDLNNALTAVVGYTELALAELAEGHPARQDVDEIRRAAGRAASVARQLLAFSRKQMLEPRLFDVNSAIDGLARLLRSTLGENVTLRTVLAPGLPSVMGDAGQVEQAIVNLAVNARDAMPHGGQVVILTAVEDVTDALSRHHAPMPSGRYVVVSVTDTGHGIDRETQARIFEPFFTTKSVGKGTGLGLTMVYGTMKQCGGFIFVESAIGRGATFRLYFPPVGMDNALAAGAGDAPPPSTKTVLVVEDEPAILKLVTTALGVDGYRVLQAASGAEALEVADACDGTIDLIVTDATMPAMGGVELTHKLLATRPALAVIVMSGLSQDLSGIEATGRSISTLQKPFTPMELRAKVRNALRSSKA